MKGTTLPPAAYGSRMRGVTSADVERAADHLLRAGERPTVEKIRAKLGTGSPNTINPLLDAWWKRLSNRLDTGPAALHRLPETVVHIAESLWMQALEEGRLRAQAELRSERRTADQTQDSFEVRSHVLSLREGEMESRLREREHQLHELEAQVRILTILLQKEQRTRESQAGNLTKLQAELARQAALRKNRLRRGPSKSKKRLKVNRKSPAKPRAKKRKTKSKR